MTDIENALGQYNLYHAILSKVAPERKLYLAISTTIFEKLENIASFQLIVETYHIALILVHLDTEEITEWKD